MLGEFEYLVLAAASRLGEEAYGAAIRSEIEGTAGINCSIGALYTTIDRLERKSLIRTWMGGATAQRGGRARRMVEVTVAGKQAAAEFYNAVVQVSRGLKWDGAKPGAKR